MKKLRITVEGKTYDVTVEVLGDTGTPIAPAPAPAQIVSAPSTQAAAAEPAVLPAGAAEDVVSQLAGTVVSVEVSVGQSVAAGDGLLTIEAMKMNTSIIAPKAGTVTAVAVAAGAVVEEGQLLVTLA
ncbi:MAG: biotin/lipoyl-binding protein [Rhodospirillales bacterium]|jgi:glutaconyl-CoA/methylmalonyl-CoA decarboxylase subunit gamma|nr:biotin/lipoyl-binding protein [Rhodospirillales bacterium]